MRYYQVSVDYCKQLFPKSKFRFDPKTGNISEIIMNLNKVFVREIYLSKDKRKMIVNFHISANGWEDELVIKKGKDDGIIESSDIDNTRAEIEKVIFNFIDFYHWFYPFKLSYRKSDLLIYVDNLIHGMKSQLEK